MKVYLHLATVLRVLAKHGLKEVAERIRFSGKGAKDAEYEPAKSFLMASLPTPERMRLILEELGPSFIKLGQLLSTRADLLPPEYIEELKKLQDRVPPEKFETIERTLRQELKRPVFELFRDLVREPIGSASVAQVHRATLPSGEEVAVKIVRPGIRKRIREDIRLMYFLADKLQKVSGMARALQLSDVVAEFEQTIYKELDMFVEAGSIDKFAANFASVDEVHIPSVYWNLTTKSILTMEFIDGIKMDQVDQIVAHGIDPGEIALIGLRSFSRQLMEFGFFHADPHPGNTIVMYDGRVGLVDFGITGYLDEKTMLQIAGIFYGYSEHNYELVIDALKDLRILEEDRIDMDAFTRDLIEMSEQFYGRALSNVTIKDVYEQVILLILRYQIRMPRNLLLLLKTFVQAEALGKILSSNASILEVTKPFARDLIMRGAGPQRMSKTAVRDLRFTAGFLRTMPELLLNITRQLSKGKQRIEIYHTGFQPLDAKIERGVNRLVVGIVISASLIASAFILNSPKTVIQIPLHWLGFDLIPLTELLGLIGYVMASWLGIWLIVSIFRSGKL